MKNDALIEKVETGIQTDKAEKISQKGKEIRQKLQHILAVKRKLANIY